MNKRILTLTISTILFAACGQNLNQSTPTSKADTATSPPPTQTTAPTPLPVEETQPSATAEQESAPSSDSDQEALKDEWRTAYGSSVILFRSCELMFNTFTQLEFSEIDVAEAREDFATEFFFIRLAYNWNADWQTTNDAVLPFKESLWDSTQNLLTLVDQVEQMSDSDLPAPGFAFTDNLFNACFTFNGILSGLVPTAMNAGLTEDSLNQLDLELQEMLSDLDSVLE